MHNHVPDRRIFAVAIVMLFGSLSTQAQLPGNIRSLSIDAHDRQIGEAMIATITKLRNYWFSVHDLSRKIPRVDVEIFFIRPKSWQWEVADLQTGRCSR